MADYQLETIVIPIHVTDQDLSSAMSHWITEASQLNLNAKFRQALPNKPKPADKR